MVRSRRSLHRRFKLLEQLRCLIEYQVLEDKKAQLIRGYEDTPKRLAEIEKEFQEIEGTYLSKKAEHDNAKKLHRSLEQNIADLGARIARSKKRMGEVKTNKEYHAILKEIEEIKKEISAREDESLEIMETVESLGREMAELEKEINGRKSKLEEDRKLLQKESAQLKERLDRLESIQEKVRGKLKPDLLKRSEFLIKKQAGVAVAAVQNGVCQVCHMNIPPQKFIELQRDDAIHQCPHCHRFLFWAGHESYCVPEEDIGEL
jgi:uncharacterized protein